MTQNRRGIGISLDYVIIDKIDIARGLVSRSRFIEKIITETLGELKNE